MPLRLIKVMLAEKDASIERGWRERARIIADKTRKGSASIRSIRVIRVLSTRTPM